MSDIRYALRMKTKEDQNDQRRKIFKDYVELAMEQGCSREQSEAAFLHVKFLNRLKTIHGPIMLLGAGMGVMFGSPVGVVLIIGLVMLLFVMEIVFNLSDIEVYYGDK